MNLPPDIAPLEMPAVTSSVAATELRLGFMPLSDSAPLIVAQMLGLFRKHGVNVTLSPVNAWVALRDRMAIGQLDGGHLLSPMPIATALGLGGVARDISVVSVLASQGNSITFGEALMAEIEAAAPDLAAIRPLPAKALAAALLCRKAAGLPVPVIAIVYPFSSHNYLLRHWLASAGIDPDTDILLRAVPPPWVADELAEGRIDGFCAGQPWGSRAVDLRCGRIVLGTGDVWHGHPEKVFAVSSATLARAPDMVIAAVAATIEAGAFLADPANLRQAARWVHLFAMPQVPLSVVEQSLSRQIPLSADEEPRAFPCSDFAPTQSRPDPVHAAWWMNQMQRWGHAAEGTSTVIESLWRPDIWRQAAMLAGFDPALAISPLCPGDFA